MSDLCRLQIRCPDGISSNAELLLDGAPLKGVTSLSFLMRPDKILVAYLEIEMPSMDIDIGLVKRVLESPATNLKPNDPSL